jgi:uncharacterized membrane protein|tara:strand:- start:4353 stop:4856 length:504 start_codon:yes stop_codon:yes gene_type:complete
MENKIDELEYLMNPVMYDKWISNDKNEDISIFNNDLKFYKKRILQLTKDKFKEIPLNNQSDKAFIDYTKSCIAYLKSLDKKDIIQEDYKELELLDEINDNDILDIDPNEVIINPTYKKKELLISDCLDIKKISTKNVCDTIFPNKKNLELKTPELKIKGIKKKKKNK